MTPAVLLSFLVIYFLVLIGISYFTSRRSADNASFFIANRSSKWYLVAFGMIGVALSGITFISVPGAVGNSNFGYFQFVLGNAVGFIIIATVLLPLYYRVRLISIYTYLEKRLGFWSYKSGAMIFLISRTIGASFRLYLVAIVLQKFIFDAWQVPFAVTIILCLALIWIYTRRGGLKTIIITDTLQTLFLLLSVALSIWFISRGMGYNLGDAFRAVKETSYSTIFSWEDFLGNKQHFLKQFLGGIFVTIAMTGLDQDLMQKNISMKTVGEAQKNMLSFTVVFVVINLFFLSVGALLYLYASANQVDVGALATPDHLFPEIALNHLPVVAGVIFMTGLTASTFSTADSALTALTTSFCVDFLGFEKKDGNDPGLIRTRYGVHIAFSAVILGVILVFRVINDDSVVNAIFKAAGYTYGPLLGLFSFGMISKRAVADRLVPFICLLSPAICYVIDIRSVSWIGYAMSFELIVLNGLITYVLLWITSSKPKGES